MISELVAVKGIGDWSAHMFLIFHLQRPDVLAVGDLGIRKAVQLAYGLETLPDPKTLQEIAIPWSPHAHSPADSCGVRSMQRRPSAYSNPWLSAEKLVTCAAGGIAGDGCGPYDGKSICIETLPPLPPIVSGSVITIRRTRLAESI